MEVRQAGDEGAVRLLGPRGRCVPGPQARLDVPHRDLLIESGQGRAEGSRGISLDQHEIGPVLRQIFIECRDGAGGQIAQRLARLHEIEIAVYPDRQYLQHLVEHLAVLGGSQHEGRRVKGLQFPEDRVELDRLGPGSHVLVVWYPTVVANYRCTFEVEFEAGQSYEIIERSDRFPVFLNRMEEGILFSLLSRRVERFPPRECTKIKEADES